MGLALEFVYEGKVELPKDYMPELPSTVDLKEDFAEYHSAYAFKDGVLSNQRRLIIKTKEIAKEQFEAYRKFAKAANDDGSQYISLKSTAEVAAGEKHNPEADRLFKLAREAMGRRDIRGALDYFTKTLALEPNYEGAWTGVGAIRLVLNDRDEGIAALRKEIELHPQFTYAYRALASALTAMQRTPEAVAVWQALRKVYPEDREASANAGYLLLQLKRYSEAVPVLEAAAELNPKDSAAHFGLAMAYLETEQADKAQAAYQKAAELDPTPNTWNNIAYTLADKGQKLPEALRYAELAEKEQEKRTAEIRLEKLDLSDLKATDLLGAIWDTIGWAYFRLGDLDDAETYLSAGWNLQQLPVQADHLGQVYEKQGKKQAAIRAYAWALAASGADIRGQVPAPVIPLASANFPGKDETGERLLKLLGNTTQLDVRVRGAAEELSRLRTVKVKPILSRFASAEFFVVISPGPKVEGVKFISGDESLRKAGDSLSTAKFDVPFPADRPAKLLRRGILMCHSISSGCEFVMYPPNSVFSIH